jgi:hypothetical protein
MARNPTMSEESVDIAISLLSAGFPYAVISRSLNTPIATLHRTLQRLPLSLQTPQRILALFRAQQTRKEMVPSA